MKLRNVTIITLMTILLLIVINTAVFAKTVVVDTDTLRFRREPNKDADTIELLDRGDKLEYLDEEGDWYKAKINNTTGYVSKDYCKIVEDKKEETTTETKVETPAETTTETETKEETKTEVEETKQEETAVEESVEMKVIKDSRVYILPLINANRIDTVKADTNVRIISKTNGWYYVETENVLGWVRKAALEETDTTTENKEEEKEEETKVEEETKKEETNSDKEITAKIMYVNSSSIYIRKGPSTDTEVVDSLVLNNTVKVVAENGDWYKVDVDGKSGYIAKRLLSDSATSTDRGTAARTTTTSNNGYETPDTSEVDTTSSSGSSRGQQVVDMAKQYLGCKYVYGASGPSTFDCSGFTMYIYRNFGISLSHSATAQSRVGTPVAKSDLQAGDLVFFTDYETGEGIGHVGIYIGGGDFIHASSGTGYCVKISTLLSGSYYNRYYSATRVL